MASPGWWRRGGPARGHDIHAARVALAGAAGREIVKPIWLMGMVLTLAMSGVASAADSPTFTDEVVYDWGGNPHLGSLVLIRALTSLRSFCFGSEP